MAVTIRDLAKACGLSVSAISKALNGYTDISHQTREQVQQVARDMGYFPNAQARALKTNRSYNIGVMNEVSSRDGLLHSFFASILDGFKKEIEQSGYDMTFLSHRIGAQSVSVLDHCHYRSMDGAILACVDFTDLQTLALGASSVPCVTIDHKLEGCPCVLSDNRDGTAALVRYVASRGHRRIGFVHGGANSVTNARVAGFEFAMKSLDIEIIPELIQTAIYHHPESNRRAIEKLMSLPEPPTCILLTDDYAALGAMDALRERHLQIGKDISVAGYDGIVMGQMLRPRLTTYRQDTKRMGYEAARLLIKRIEHPSLPIPRPIVVQGELIEGETIADIRSCAPPVRE